MVEWANLQLGRTDDYADVGFKSRYLYYGRKGAL